MPSPNYTKEELLKYLIDNDMINLPSIEEQINMNIRARYLDMHDHKIWQSTDGRWCTYLTNPNKPKNRGLCKRKTLKEVEDAIVEYWKAKEENPTINEVFNEWNESKLQRGKIKKITYDINNSVFKRFYSEFGKRRIKNVDELEWESFLCQCINNKRITAKCFANLKGVTKGFLKRAKKRGLISINVEQFFTELDVSDNDFKKVVIDDSKEIFYDDEVEKIMAYIIDNPDLKNIGIALMFVTGIRIGELIVLKHSDFHGTTFDIKREQTRHKKPGGGYEYEVDDFPKTPAGYRTVIVPEKQSWIINKLLSFNPDSDYIFLDTQGRIMSTDMVRKRLYLVCKKVGIPKKSPHKIRKTYGSILLDNGLDAKLIETQMGHTNITCTERFYHRNRRRNDERQKIINSIPEFI